MIIRLNEQRFTNKNKIWYRGREEIDTEFEDWGCLYLTSSLVYAYSYALGEKGFIEERVFENTPLNIFNAQNPAEYRLIEKHFPILASQLKKGNWYEIMGKEKRGEFLKILKSFKYDGFINFEDDGDVAPSIGIFNPKNARLVNTLTKEEVRKTKEFQNYYMMEKRFVVNSIKLHFLENKDIHFNKTLYLFSKKELKETFQRMRKRNRSSCKLVLKKNRCRI